MAETIHGVSLSSKTTLRVGGPAREYIEASCPDELVESVRSAQEAGERVFVLGSGSNVLVSDAGFDGVVVHPVYGGIDIAPCDGGVLLRAGAGCVWDDLVGRCVEDGLGGVEALSGIPGTIGSAVMQNIGAYGQEAGASLVGARLYDRLDGGVRAWSRDELRLGYRTSMLRESLEGSAAGGGGRWHPTSRWVVLDATFMLRPSDRGSIDHPQLARALGCEVGEEAPIAQIRSSVLEVRASKGMVADLDADPRRAEHDRWSTGSFFTNPVVDPRVAETLPADAPRYAAGGSGGVKTSAAWLIEHAGFPRGYGVHGRGSAATLSTRHTLAITNRGSATAADIVELARTVRDGVRDAFGIELVPETVLVGVSLDG